MTFGFNSIPFLARATPVASGFDPASLFASSEQGGWYDPSDLSTLWQDTAGTTAITADGQSVARIDDKSGRGNHLTQSDAAFRPLYKVSGGLHWLEFDGTNDCLFGASAMDMSASDKAAQFVGVRRNLDSGTLILCELSPNINSNAGAFIMTAPNSTIIRYTAASRGSASFTTGHLATDTVSAAAPVSSVVTTAHDISGNLSRLTVNRGTPTTSTSSQGTGNFSSTQALYLGSRGNASNYFQGRVYGVIIRGGVPTSGQIADVEDYLAAKSGVTL